MNTSIISSTNGGSPHIAASSRSRATSARRQPEAPGDVGQRHLAPLHQPRQHHQQPAAAAPRPCADRPPGAIRRPPSRAASRRRRAARPAATAPRRGRAARAPTSGTPGRWRTAPRRRSAPSAWRATTRSAPSSRTTPPARAASTRTDGDGVGTAGAELLRVDAGTRSRRSKPAGRSNVVVVDRRSTVALDAVDAVRAQLVVLVVAPDDVPEPGAQQQPVRIEPAVACRGSRTSTARTARRRVAQRRQAGQLGHGGRHGDVAGGLAVDRCRGRASTAPRGPGVGRTAATATCRAAHLVGLEVQVGQLVAVAVDPVRAGAGLRRR